ncbi:MAG: hypothetical protein HUK11_04530 [Muribaculaceae bacterium]|nr:hypothetical protein [Muribaculaceae bacterium]
MIRLILLLILGFLLFLLWRAWLITKRFRDSLSQAQRKARDAFMGGYGTSPEHEQQPHVFSDEEIDVEFESVDEPRQQVEQPTDVKNENQVIDAEFEDA